jgi:hypothetical protein
MLNFHLARDKVSENLHIAERALLPTFLNRLAPMRVKIEPERFLIKQVTRVVSVTGRTPQGAFALPGRMRSDLPKCSLAA